MIIVILEVDERWIHIMWVLNLTQFYERYGLFNEKNIIHL